MKNLREHKKGDAAILHHMKLQPEPFWKICTGEKTIELRLNDPKRRKIAVGDQIEFMNIRDQEQKIRARVLAIHKFRDFAQLYENLPMSACGYKEGERADPRDMESYYSADDQEKFGVVGIEIELTGRAAGL